MQKRHDEVKFLPPSSCPPLCPPAPRLTPYPLLPRPATPRLTPPPPSHPALPCYTLRLTPLQVFDGLVVRVQLEQRLAEEEVALDVAGVHGGVQRAPAVGAGQLPLLQLQVAERTIREVVRHVRVLNLGTGTQAEMMKEEKVGYQSTFN